MIQNKHLHQKVKEKGEGGSRQGKGGLLVKMGEVREVYSDKIVSEQRHEGCERENDENIWEKMDLGRGNTKYKSLRHE